MNARDHGLAQSVAADEPAISAPASPPRRDPVEDADPSLTRKRPRLDSGSNSVRAMSADPAPSDHAAACPREQLVEMTIRSHPPSSPTHAPDDASSNATAGSEMLQQARDDSPIVIASTANEPGSPPVMIIDDEDEPTLGYSIRLDAEHHFRQFPYSHHGYYTQIVRDLPQYVQGSVPVDHELLPMLADWLNNLPEPSGEDLHSFYQGKGIFWDDFASVVNKLLNRRAPFGDSFPENDLTGSMLCRFLAAYVKLCSNLFLVDIHQLSQPRADTIFPSALLSYKHVRLLHNIIRIEKAPVFQLLHKEYDTDIRDMNLQLRKHFLKARGAQNLLRLLDEVFHSVNPKTQDHYAMFAVQTLNCLGWDIFEMPGTDTYIPRMEFFRALLSIFQKYSADLQDPSRAIDSSVARDLITYFGLLLHELCVWDPSIAVELSDQLLDFGIPESPTVTSPTIHQARDVNEYRQDPACFPALCMNAWKFKVLRKCVVKGNMALRVMSIATMDAALVEVWQKYNSSEPPGYHPVMQYLADFLLQGQVVDYIVSVDSHPQLISRSGNIVGFLVVTHRWSDAQADAIWNTVSTSTDPRVVTATVAMLRGIIHLMEPIHRLYLSEKLHDLPLDRYTLDILRFLRDLVAKAHTREPLVCDGRGSTSHPWNVCIRIIRETAPCSTTDKASLDLHAEATDQLQYMIPYIPVDERHTILLESAQYIAERSDLATGSVLTISMFVSSPDPGDDLFFEQNQDFVRFILEEIPSFIKKESQSACYPHQLQALQYRLELLRLMICDATLAFPKDLYQELWDHIVGEHSLSSEGRDLAWTQLIHAVKTSPNNDFCTQLVSSYIPSMNSRLFTGGLFEFVAHYPSYITRQKLDTGDTLLQIPGADFLWPMILSAPAGTIEDRAAQLLAIRYVKIVEDGGVLLTEVEDAHVALVNRCMSELRAAFESISKASVDTTPSEGTELSKSMNEGHITEVRFGRILLFQKILLELVRQRPEFNRGKRIDSKVETPEAEDLSGESIIVRYQCGNDRQTVSMDATHTMDDLYRRLCRATGHSKINLFAKGQRLQRSENATTTLSELDFGGQVIVQRAEGAETTHPLSGPTRGSSIFETTLVAHFDELFAWMDSDNVTSRMIFDFLSSIPAPPTFADRITSDQTSTEELFPPGKVFQAKYVAQSLQGQLREQIRNPALNENFISKAVQHLEAAIIDTRLLSASIEQPQELHLAAVFVDVLLEFLRERPSSEISAGYFSNGIGLVNRLMLISSVAISTPQYTQAAHDAYAAILEASLHSRVVWEAFIGHSDFQSMHKTLLLVHPQEIIRESISRKIFSICGGDLPSTSPITRAETAARFWSVISTIIPDSEEYAGQSQQLFEIGEQVFRTNDEYSRNEASLRGCLADWSSLLVNHTHVEFVGREVVDHIVLGLTRLLLCCILSLKSFKKPVEAGSLMTQVFGKYIFANSAISADASSKALQLPVLESHTRQVLYDLMLSLAEDRNSYDTLLQLAGKVEDDNLEPTLAPNLVDRTLEIRSSTGYVGLYNPRSICYMNSLMTQLFMNQEFRQFILSIEIQDPRNAQRLLFETQKLFAEMQNSYRRSTDPRNFVAWVKSLDKTPIDITVQMDADEFYNLLFDQWEAQLFKPEHKQKFRSFYGGQNLNQIKSKECIHVSERAEPFFAVQCDVQGKANLHESLQAYVEGDVMEGDNKYKCESCNGQFVDAVKRTCLKEAPDNLIFHLKRFEFDLTDFSRRKITDHFAFPESLDISPYKIEHLSDRTKPCQEDTFDLVGVLVHTGSCDNGHYYSYIRERPDQNPASAPTWVEFNDSDVGLFNPTELGDRAFGGFTDSDGYNRQIKHFSAYMLFYQRRSTMERISGQELTISPTDPPKVAVPKVLAAEIDANNDLFIRDYCLFDPVHARFVRQLHATLRTINHGTCSEDHSQESSALHILLAHLSRVAWRQHKEDIFLDLLPQLRRSTLSCSACCKIALSWLAADDCAFSDIFFRCSHPKVRSQFRTFLIEGLKYLRDQEPILYGLDASESDMEIDSDSPSDGVLAAIVKRLRKTADDSAESTRGWEDFYLTMTQLAEIGPFETAAILNEGFLIFCLKLFCMNAQEGLRKQFPEFAHILEKKKGIFNRLIGFTWKLLSTMDLRLPPISREKTFDRYSTLNRERMRFPLSREERYWLLFWSNEFNSIAVLDKILEVFDDTKMEHFYPGDIIKWMIQAPDEQVQTSVKDAMFEGFTLESPYCDAYVRAALSYCEACPRPDYVEKMVGSIARGIGPTKRLSEDRSFSTDVVLGFFAGLAEAQNDRLFELHHPHLFHELLMRYSRLYALPLLCSLDDGVRKETQTFLAQLYQNEDAIPPETLVAKYTSIRKLLPDMMHRIAYEKDSGQLRSPMMPMVDTCRIFVGQLFDLMRRTEPEIQRFKDANDTALIFQYQEEIDPRLLVWPHDHGTPLSTGEGFDQSDYGSESDDAHEILDIDE